MDQLSNINSLYMWPILITLIVLNFFVGRKASPNRGLLVEGGKYSRPLDALERDPGAKEQLFKRWDEDARRHLRSALRWDFLFILLYISSNVLACFMAGRFLDAHKVPFKISLVVILLQPVAGLFDVIENLIMLRVIDGLTSNVWLTIARISTVAKFTLIGLGIAHALIGFFAWFCLRWLSSATSS